ncbi:MAG: LysM peptidoglycan-binding domain-containing protein [Paracoccaceae bacterium]
MAAIPYLWYWIVGGLVAVFIATVAIFSERNAPDIAESKATLSEEKDPSKPEEDESVIDQKSDPVSEIGEASEKIEDDVKSQEAEVITEKSTDESAPVEKVTIYPPKLETVRIDDDGTALVAGMAYPGSILEILVDEQVVESITLGQDGNFAVLFDIEIKDRPQVISIRSVDGEIILVSEETMIVAPKAIVVAEAKIENNETENKNSELANSTERGGNPEKPNDAVSIENSSNNLPDETKEQVKTDQIVSDNKVSDNSITQSDLTIKTPQLPKPTEEKIEEDVQQILTQEPSDSDLTSIAEANEAEQSSVLLSNTEPNETEQPTVLLADREGVKVVQSGKTGPNVMTDVMFDTINYSKDGDVAVTGRGTPESIVHFYLDNSPVASTAVDKQGYWSADLSDVEAGVYTLRLDQLDQSGKVSSRIESPFKREDRSVLVDQMQDIASPARINVITVQPGNTLWAISRERYGRGILYVQVFDANKDKIRDPDLIYPGQIFDLPDSITVN